MSTFVPRDNRPFKTEKSASYFTGIMNDGKNCTVLDVGVGIGNIVSCNTTNLFICMKQKDIWHTKIDYIVSSDRENF